MTNLEVKLILDRIDKVEKDAKEANKLLRREIADVNANVNKILLWRATIVGGAIATSAVVGFATQYVLAWATK